MWDPSAYSWELKSAIPFDLLYAGKLFFFERDYMQEKLEGEERE